MSSETSRGTVSEQQIRRALCYTRTMTIARVTKVFASGWVEVDPQIQLMQQGPDKKLTPLNIGVLSRVPIGMFKAGGFVLTLPVAKGDEGILVCSDRSLEMWKVSGVKAPPAKRHFHDLSDSVFIPFPTSQAGAIQNYDSASLYAGMEDGSAFLQVSAGGQAKIFAATKITFDSPDVEFTGNTLTQGNEVVMGDETVNGNSATVGTLAVNGMTQLTGAVTTGATVSSAGIHTAPDFVKT